jgi:hypothetical protein
MSHSFRNLRRRNVSLIILSVVGALVVIIAVVAGLSGSKTPAASKPSAPPVVAASSSEPAVQNSTPAPPPSLPLAELEQQWAAGPAGAAGDAVVSDLKSFQAEMADVQARDYGPVAATCQQLETDATAALSEPANPDPNVAQHLSAAYADFQSSAAACVTGVQTLDASLLKQAANQLSQANTQIQDAITAIETDCPECNLKVQGTDI